MPLKQLVIIWDTGLTPFTTKNLHDKGQEITMLELPPSRTIFYANKPAGHLPL